VVFVNGTTVSDRQRSIRVFDYVKPAAGIGLRIMADKLSRTNIAIDIAVGENSTGIYFGATEVF
jgi:hypothetical protein